MVEEEMFSFDDSETVSFTGKKTEFLGKIPAGQSVTVRFLMEIDKWPKAYKHSFVLVDKNGKAYTKYVKADKGAGDRNIGSFVCINSKQNIAKGVVCPFCEAGLKPKASFGVPVIDRSTNSVKLYESTHSTVYRQLMAEYEQNGTVCDVDYKISRTGNGLETKYSVVAIRKTQSALTQDQIQSAGKVKIERYFTPRTRQEILDVMVGKKATNGDAPINEGEEDEQPVPF
jgi:hypothetical protein